MGRKKKITIEEQLKPEESKTSYSNSLAYQGTVKVSIQKDKKTISSRTFHNEGKINLFKFICNCLAGNYSADARPCKLALFSGNTSELIDADDINLFTDANLCTPVVLNDTTAVVEKDTDSTISSRTKDFYKVTYHFRIPYTYIAASEIYKMALFNMSPVLTYAADIVDSLYATYKFTTKTGTSEVWDPIQIDTTVKGNFSIVVEWTMQIKNK